MIATLLEPHIEVKNGIAELWRAAEDEEYDQLEQLCQWITLTYE